MKKDVWTRLSSQNIRDTDDVIPRINESVPF